MMCFRFPVAFGGFASLVPPFAKAWRLALVLGVAVGFVAEGAASAGSRKSYQVKRTDLEIEIDGQLDDEAWSHARAEDSFRQVIPDEGAPPTEGTVVRVLHDGRFLYVGVRMTDSRSDSMIANQMVQVRQRLGEDGS
jgi:hypothetical protein